MYERTYFRSFAVFHNAEQFRFRCFWPGNTMDGKDLVTVVFPSVADADTFEELVPEAVRYDPKKK